MGNITSLIIILTLLVSFTGFTISNPVFAENNDIIESVTENHLKSDNQTVTNVYVTLENNDSINGAVMHSSAVIIGFTSLGALIEIAKISELALRFRSFLFVYGQITLMVTLHFIAMLFAYQDKLSGEHYFWTIVATIVLVIGIISSVAWLVIEKHQSILKTKKREHLVKTTFDDIVPIMPKKNFPVTDKKKENG